MLMKTVEQESHVNVDSSCVGIDGFISQESTEEGDSQGGSELVGLDTYQLLIRTLKNNSAEGNSFPS